MSSLGFIDRAQARAEHLGVIAPEGRFSYGDLLDASARAAQVLLDGRDDLREARVAFLAPAGWDYVVTLWAIWRAGGVAVPLAVSHPAPELRQIIADADPEIVVAHPDFAGVLQPIADQKSVRFIGTRTLTERTTHHAPRTPSLPAVPETRRALIIYTSGTTGTPKGVVTTHANIRAQVSSLHEAWGWSGDDRILLVLPLHHVHGIVNVLLGALWAGATCEMLPRFDAERVWDRLASGELSVFMAVPTIYHKLIGAFDAAAAERQLAWSQGAKALRLMVSGSAALPVRTLERWREITGHTLLERYGMTEIGMGLSNPYAGKRRAGFVGTPLPGVAARVVDENGAAVKAGSAGELEIRGPTVFLEYWRRPDATAAAFRDGWFRTGDVAIVEEGSFRLLGRASVDIIKTGGFKVSALEIEEVLRTHPAIAECAVVGVADEEWGERVCVALELRGGSLGLEELQRWAKELLAPYKVPRDLRVVGALPRNAMGKVTKPDVARLFGAPNVPRPSRF